MAAASQPSPASPGDRPITKETSDAEATLKVNVNLVLVRAVVRDSRGHAVGNLHSDNFEVLADGKPQTIRYFAIDRAIPPDQATTSGSRAGHRAVGNQLNVPQRFVAYVFDDVHLKSPDLVNAKSAAARHLASLASGDRVAIFSMSGHVVLDFTNDQTKIRENISKLQPAPIRTGVGEQLLSLDGIPGGGSAEDAMREQQAREQKFNDKEQGRAGLDGLAAVVRKLSILPGLKTVVVISPDFAVSDQPLDIASYQSLVERSLRAHVVINGLDPRGLVVTLPPGCDLNEDCPHGPLAAVIAPEKAPVPVWTPALMYDLSYTTGGTYFHGNNDLDEGFRRVDSIPEFSYVLGFSPVPPQSDGKVHPLKVALRNSKPFTIQARSGYYAPPHQLAGLQDVKQEMLSEILSREEAHSFPMAFHTQFYRTDPALIHLSVLVHIDVRQLHFEKVDGLNNQDLTLACALFDENENYVQGIKQDVKIRLSDESLAKLDTGFTTRADLVVMPKIYFLRIVVRDQEGRISTANDAIDAR